ncbi:DNA topoisomerase IV, alpha subunit [Trametes coccinea BRFM310]|uniref:DNA topoisomerase (ATP-hydrolyzing) n=1 Tax=Trametes coccinea (strain BRFM310) TaxID=1353009 RepID=A0A1Y2ISG1_TRAC3|nr:DNA topoisomerase IV, alpha subunit [Trametes coccinea BRFM310]
MMPQSRPEALDSAYTHVDPLQQSGEQRTKFPQHTQPLGSFQAQAADMLQCQWNCVDDDDIDLPLAISDDETGEMLHRVEPIVYSGAAFETMQLITTGEDDSAPEADIEEDEDIRDEALHQIEGLVLSFMTQLVASLPASGAYSQIASKKGGYKKIALRLADRRKEPTTSDLNMRTLEMPRGARGASARPFAQLFRTLDLMHKALTDDIPTTKRDMYYKDVELFGSQSTVDSLVDDLAATFQIGRADLNVRASSKGLVCGAGLRLHLHSGEILAVSDSEPILIPPSEDIERFEVDSNLAWVLVVEKEAVFQTLCRLRLGTHHALPGNGLVVTGKGYPDVATRQLVKTLSANLPEQIPILGLVDGDAYGIDILSVYKYGSMRMRHEQEQLAAERVQWLGLWSSELAGLGIERDALIPITKYDEKKARVLLKRKSTPPHWRRELQHMLFTRRKAEIEILEALRSPTRPAEAAEAGGIRAAEAGNPGIPLLRYLSAKISTACMEAARREP